MDFRVNIYIATSYKGPSRGKGAGMWIVEYKGNRREGIIFLPDGTDNQATLISVTNSLSILKKSCFARINIPQNSIFHSIQNGWLERWKENGWKTSYGDPVKNHALWKKMAFTMSFHTCEFISEPHRYTQTMEERLTEEVRIHWPEA